MSRVKKKKVSDSGSNRLSEAVMEAMLKNMQTYGMLGLVLGVIIVLAGVVLIVLGFTDSVDVTFQSGSSKGHIATGSLGVVIAVVGVAIVLLTKPRGEITPTRIVRRMRRGR